MKEEKELSYTVNGVAVTVGSKLHRRVPIIVPIALCCAVALVALLAPTPALAAEWDWTDPLGSMSNWMIEAVNSLAQSGLDGISGTVNDTISKDWFTNGFTALLPGSESTALYDMAKTISRYTIYPVAVTVLSLTFLLQLLKIAQRIDGNSAMPALKEIFILFVVLALCTYAVGHSFSLTKDFYDLVNSWGSRLVRDNNTTLRLTADLNGDLGAGIYIGLLGLLVTAILMLSNVVTKTMFVARAIQLYLYAIFSPLMLSMLGVDEMRHWAMGYIKGFLACCLSGFVMLFALYAYPYATAAVLGQGATVTGKVYAVTVTSSSAASSFTSIICISFAMALLCINSGSYARDILGG